MSISVVYKPVGPTVALSVTASAHTPVAVPASNSESGILAAFTNPGTVSVFVEVLQLSSTGAAPGLTTTNTPSFPVDGTSTSVVPGVLLPPLMEAPIVMPAPFTNGGFAVTAIGAGAGPTIIYVTPVTPQ